jgi:hypothetical protein
MRGRSKHYPVLLLSAALAGCAVGAPIGDDIDGVELAPAQRSEPLTVHTELFVEVIDHAGRPLGAQAVWVAVKPGQRRPFACMEEGARGCETWFGRFEPDDAVMVYAQVCGLLYLEPLVLDPEGVQAGETQGIALDVVADDTACGYPPVTRSGD